MSWFDAMIRILRPPCCAKSASGSVRLASTPPVAASICRLSNFMSCPPRLRASDNVARFIQFSCHQQIRRRALGGFVVAKSIVVARAILRDVTERDVAEHLLARTLARIAVAGAA